MKSFTGSHRLAAASYLHCFSMLSEPHCSVLNALNACNLREGWSRSPGNVNPKGFM